MTNHSDMIKARNVIATLPGTDLPEEKIVIGGHLDSGTWLPVRSIMVLVHLPYWILPVPFKPTKLKPRRTVQFVMFMGEEQGLHRFTSW